MVSQEILDVLPHKIDLSLREEGVRHSFLLKEYAPVQVSEKDLGEFLRHFIQQLRHFIKGIFHTIPSCLPSLYIRAGVGTSKNSNGGPSHGRIPYPIARKVCQ